MVRLFISILTCILAVYAAVASAGENEKPKKIVLIAGTKSHGPGHHEYELGMRVIKHCLDSSPNAPAVTTEVHLHGWPTDESTLDDADTIVLFCDGSDHDVKAHPILHGDRLKTLGKQMKRGCGLVAIHYTVFVPTERGGPEFLEWIGGFFDYQTGKTPNHWYSKIQNADTQAEPASPDHPISRGLTPFQLSEEYYYNIRFRDGDQRRVPILNTPIPGEPNQHTVAWAVERADGGRGFGFTGGHYHSNWSVENYRRMILNAVLWTAKADVPAAGVQSQLPSTQPKPADDAKRDAAKVLIVTGHQYPGHPWRETTKSIERSLGVDKRLAVDVVVDPEFLAKDELQKYQTIILNYCNWERRGLSEESKQNFVEYLKGGGGLVIVHFANGAFHFSLPKAGDSDWPEFRNICRRVWDHTPGKSAHDAYGKFRVDISTTRHPITLGMQAFETTDELYFAQQGDQPIEVLTTGRSKITGKDEPLAFVYEYGKGRVFQTLLGHDAASIDAPGTAALVRRAAAWTSGLPLAPEAPLTAGAPQKPALTDGRFGKALDATSTVLTVPHKPEYKSLPLTVECWAKISGKDRFNVVIASAPKESTDHWELYSYVGVGDFSVYLPGYMPAELRSGVEIADDRWHYLALTLDGKKAALYVDGKLAKETAVQRIRQAGPDGPLWIGGYPPGGIGCNGLIDEVRISKSIRTIDTTPEQPLSPDSATVGLWHFDAVDNQGHSPDDSSFKNDAAIGALSRSDGTGAAKSTEPKNHFGREVVGFDWTENDSRDDRWNKTDVGQFLSASFPSATGPVLKGLAIRVGDNDEAAVCYDTGQLSFRAAWRGKFVAFDPARFGLIAPPRFAGTVELLGPNEPAWPVKSARYLGLHTNGKRTVLAYEVDGCRVLESPWSESADGAQAFTREFEIAASNEPLRIPICLAPGVYGETDSDGPLITRVEEKNRAIAATVRGHPAKIVYADGRLLLDVPARRQTARIKLFTWTEPKDRISQFASLARRSAPPLDLSKLTQPGSRRWKHELITRGQRAADDRPLVVDTLTLPFDNPYRALMFTSGHDFFANGNAAVCTVHGDVWIVSGIDDRLEKLSWRRFATGLYQPLGLRIVNDKVYVLGRDQITLLHDENRDSEADYYECFSNLAKTSAEGHDYSACLETDRDGNFLFVSAAQGVVRISPDGRKLETLADGLRNPNGLAVSPTGIITVSPQEGNWTPASSIFEVQPGDYYGFGGPRATPDRPLGYDPPLCWISRQVDNSSGGQVWVTSNAWNPLVGQLLHFSYGRCTMLLTLRETIDSRAQGAVVPLPVQFDSGAMRGRFHPRDGQLYVTGLKGWVSSAAQDGCFQRVRYTSKPLYLPTGIQTRANGVKLSFSEPLNPLSAGDPDNYFVEQWNYHWTADYGSADFKASDPKQEGHDTVDVRSATVLDNGRSVFLEIDRLQPVMQMALQLKLRAADGKPVEHTVYHTINRLPIQRIDPAPDPRIVRPGQLDDQTVARLKPGLIATFRQRDGKGERTDVRSSRLAALSVPSNQPATPRLLPGGFGAELHGYLHMPIKDECSFFYEGNGKLELQINGAPVPVARRGESAAENVVPIVLRKGYNQIGMRYQPPSSGNARFRLLWSSKQFVREPVPPAILFHDSGYEQLETANSWRHGRELFATHGCASCHQLGDASLENIALPEIARRGPSLDKIGDRLSTAWIAAWIEDPRAFRSDSTMPRLLHGDNPQQQAADLAAFLTSTSPPSPSTDETTDDTAVEQGERLYESLSCLGCHRLGSQSPPPDTADMLDRVPLDFVAAKYRGDALEAYLQNPQQHHRGTRMPNFKLSPEEASSLAAYLRSVTTAAPLNAELVGNPNRGKKIFETVGCQSCHETAAPNERTRTAAKLIAIVDTANGCLAKSPAQRRDAPDFALSDTQRSALRDFVAQPGNSLAFDPAVEASARLVRSLRCAACHARDGKPSQLIGILQEESFTGLPPETIPQLTWAGDKLRSDWTSQLLSGQREHRSRPWLRARMPAFPAYAQALSSGLAAEHGLSATAEQPKPLDPEAIELGRQLTLKDRGLDCRQCHALDRSAVQQDHNAQGIGLLEVKDRLRYDFYDRWVLDPLRIDPGTKMPKFAADGQTTTVKHIYNGQARPQFDALWQYIESLESTDPAATVSAPATGQ